MKTKMTSDQKIFFTGMFFSPNPMFCQHIFLIIIKE